MQAAKQNDLPRAPGEVGGMLENMFLGRLLKGVQVQGGARCAE